MSLTEWLCQRKNECSINRAILVTGASTGIGWDCACSLAQSGFRVYAGVRHHYETFPEGVQPVFLDVTDTDSICQAADFIASDLRRVNFSGLYGLVNNAGIAVGGPLEFLPLAQIRRQFDINVFGQLEVIQAFLPLIRQSDTPGRVVNMSSIAGRSALPFLSPYSASKHALEAFSDSLRMELAPWGIRLAIIEPGSIATPIWQKSLSQGENLVGQLPPQAVPLYRKTFERVKSAIHRSACRGIPPSHVSRAVLHALTSPNPKTRYLIGTDARIRALLNVLPDHWLDRLILKKLQYE